MKSKKELRNDFLVSLGMKIIEKRKERGISQKELADIIEINPTALRRIEKGKVNTSIYQIIILCDALDIRICKLLDYDCNSTEEYSVV